MHITTTRQKELETKVSELESEAERLSHALESHKALASETSAAFSKKLDDSVRELHAKVSQ